MKEQEHQRDNIDYNYIIRYGYAGQYFRSKDVTYSGLRSVHLWTGSQPPQSSSVDTCTCRRRKGQAGERPGCRWTDPGPFASSRQTWSGRSLLRLYCCPLGPGHRWSRLSGQIFESRTTETIFIFFQFIILRWSL